MMGGFVGQIIGIFAQIENFGKALDPIGTIFERVAAVLEPLINQLFAPFVIILETIGDIIGGMLAPVLELVIAIVHPIINIVVTILNVLKPFLTVVMLLVNIFFTFNPLLIIFSAIMEFVAGLFVAFYNDILLPIANGIINIFNGLQFAFVFLYNVVSDVLKGISFGAIDMGKKTFNAMAQLEKLSSATGQVDYKQQDEYEKGSGYSGSSSVSAPKDVIVNIYFNNSYVNGDAREIALMLEQELEAAHALGY
jgi:hypothetical protein